MQKICKFIVCLVQKKTLPPHGFRHAGEGLILQLLQLDLAEAQIREVIHTLGALGCHRGSILGVARGVGALRHIGAAAAPAAAIARAAAIPVTTALAAAMIAAAAAIAVAVTAAAGSAGTCICALSHSVGVGGVDDNTAVTALALALAADALHLADGRVDDAALVGVHGLHGKAATGAAHLGTDALCQCGQEIGRAHV